MLARALSASLVLAGSLVLLWAMRRRVKARRKGAPPPAREGVDEQKADPPLLADALPLSPPVTPRDDDDFASPPFADYFLRTPEPSPLLQAALGGISPVKPLPPSRICRSLSGGPSDEVQERVRRTLAHLPGPEHIGGRRVELLVHNVSHKDLILSLTSERAPSSSAACGGGEDDQLVLCRPKFSLFQPISQGLIDATGGTRLNSCPTATFPVYTREPKQREPRQAPRERKYTLKQNQAQPALPVGFDVSPLRIPVGDLSNYRFRRDDAKGLGPSPEGAVVRGVYFPLLASIIPKWRRALGAAKEGGSPVRDDVFRVVFLVTGIGIPRDQASSSTGNSTEGTAALAEQWLARHHPDVACVRVHSATNIFRYDENIAFVKTELLPLIEHFRDLSAERWGTDWRAKFRITVSFADGSPARITAINASLRPYRPSFCHMWELKTFWHHAKMCLDDVEVHSFEDIDTAPPVPLAQADPAAHLVAEEMLNFKHEVLSAFRQGLCKDLSSFWLRKTKKPVLAVLLVQKDGQAPRLYRGCNMEVSMPTGSLCAERNAIGTALASDLTLTRRDLKLIAVLSLSIRAVPREAPPTGIDSPLLLAHNESGFGSEDGEGQRFVARDVSMTSVVSSSASPPRVTVMRTFSVDTNMLSLNSRIINVDSDDLNPLRPCGACMEWLKKIAETNPQFRAATFTDECCRGIYTEFISCV